jgi:hypothetical protein
MHNTFRIMAFLSFQLRLRLKTGIRFFETDFTVVFTRPDGSAVTAEGFYDGGKTY